MHVRTAAVACLLALAATTGCSSGSGSDDKPATTATPVASATPTVDQAAARQACLDAVKAAIDANAADTEADKPAECASLDDSAYLDAYMDALEQHNKEGRDALQDLIDQASQSAQP